MHIVVVCGTNRAGAITRQLAAKVAELYRQRGQEVDLLDMNELPQVALDPTAYAEKSPDVQAIVDRFLKSDGVVFVIPEYNGSFPGVLKLFVDMLPFPEGFDGRPSAFIGLAAGQFKALRAVEHFQQVAGYRNAHLFPRRMFIGDSYEQFVDGKLADDELNRRLCEQVDQFLEFVARIGAKKSPEGS